MPTVADVSVKFGADTSGVDKGIAHVERSIGGMQSRLGTLFGTAGGFVLGGVFNKIASGFGSLLNAGIDFEQGMANVNAVMDLTGKQAQDLEALILHLGSSTAASSTEVAGAAESLAKAGVSWSDMMSGALQGAVDLSLAAGDISSGQAAEIIANTMNMFNLSGDQATAVSDAFAAGANKSTASVDSLAQGLSQGGAAVVMFGGDLYDAIGILALFDQNSLKGADAGTALKTMLLSLLNPTNEQAQAMSDLGLSFFDTNGQFIGFSAMAEELKTKLSGLTEEQRNTALATIFGADAVRAANILYEEGAAGVDEYTDAVKEQGAATKVAEKRLDSLRGSLEQFKGALETLAITGTKLAIPFLRGLVDFGTQGVNALTGQVDRFGKWAGDFIGDVKTLKKSLQNPLGQNFGFNLGADTKKMGNMRATTQALGIQIKRLTGIDMTNWLNRMGKSILRPIDASKKLFGALTDRNWDKALAGFGDLISSGPKAIGDFFKGIETGIKPVDKLLHTFGKSWTDVGRAIQEVGQQDWDGLQVVLERLGGHLLQFGEQLGGIAFDTLKFTVNAAISVLPVLAEILWGGAKNLYEWIKGKVLGTSQGGPSADASYSGAAGYHTSTAAQSGNIIDVGKAFLSFGVELAGDIWGGAKDLYGWIKEQVTGHGGNGDPNSGSPGQVRANSQTIPVGTVLISATVNAASDLLGWIWKHKGDVVGWLRDGLNAAIDVGEVFIKGAANVAQDASSGLWGWLKTNSGTVVGWVRNGLDEAINVGEILIDGFLGLGPTLKGWIGNIGGWISGVLNGGSQSPLNGSADPALATAGISTDSVSFTNWTLRVGSPSNPLEIDFNGIKSFLQTAISTDPVKVAEWTQIGTDIGTTVGTLIGDAINAILGPSVSETMGGGKDGEGGPTALEGFGRALIEGFFSGANQAFNENVPDFLNNTFLSLWNSIVRIFQDIPILGNFYEGREWEAYILPGGGIGFRTLGAKAAEFFNNGFANEVMHSQPGDPAGEDEWLSNYLAGSGEPTGFATQVANWIKGQIAIIEDIISNPEDWLLKLASGDVLGAILSHANNVAGNENPWPYNEGNPSPSEVNPEDLKEGGGFLSSDVLKRLGKGGIAGALAGAGSDMASGWKVPPPDTSEYEEKLAKLPTLFGQAMDKSLQLATTVAVGINTALSAQFTNLVTSIGAILSPIPSIIGMPFDRALQVVSVVVGAIPNIVVGAMNSTASQGAAAAYNAGASISGALAAGIRLLIPDVYAAAHELGVAAESGTNAAIKRNSPPKVFVDMGHDIGDTLADSITDKYATVAAAGRGLGNAAIQPMANPAWNASPGRTGGDTHITIVTVESERFVAIARAAQRGEDLAKNLPTLMMNLKNA